MRLSRHGCHPPASGLKHSVLRSHDDGLSGDTVYHRFRERSDIQLFQTEQSFAVVKTSRHGL